MVVNVQRGSAGLGTIQTSQADYVQAVKGGGHGDYKMIVVAPASAQDMYDFVDLGFELGFKYRTPVMILTDGVIGQMMEKVELREMKPRLTNQEIKEKYPWATTGKKKRERNIVTSLALEAPVQEAFNNKLQAKYKVICENEVRYETYRTEDADFLIVAFGSMASISEAAVDMAREKGIKAGILRPLTLFPFHEKEDREGLV